MEGFKLVLPGLVYFKSNATTYSCLATRELFVFEHPPLHTDPKPPCLTRSLSNRSMRDFLMGCRSQLHATSENKSPILHVLRRIQIVCLLSRAQRSPVCFGRLVFWTCRRWNSSAQRQYFCSLDVRLDRDLGTLTQGTDRHQGCSSSFTKLLAG